MNRRSFLQLSAGTTLALTLTPADILAASRAERKLFRISLAEWSLNKSLRAKKFTNLDFPRVARKEFDIDCVELVDQFFSDKAKDKAYLKELKSRAAGESVELALIMVDTNGPLGAADKSKREQAVERTFDWIDAARVLGCHTVRVNAYGDGNADELRGRIAESCARLADHAHEHDINVVIENHGGLSSNAEWLVSVMKAVNKPNFGTLPDFGNFAAETNRYDAVEALMPYALAVSAKAVAFSKEGLVTDTDFFRMMRIVRDGGYHGHVGVESVGADPEGEAQSIRFTRDLLRRIRSEQVRCKPIFNGKNLRGWSVREGGKWTVEDGVLVGRDGSGWTVNPEKSGSWLSTRKQYEDFRLELQYTISKRGNSGIFFRSSHERNPAFNGYELQVYDAAGSPPSRTGPMSIYDVVAPSKNLVRPAGQWNTVTLIARGPNVQVEMNGERVMDTQLDKFTKGYIGLQIHDDKTEVRFKNIRAERL